MRIAFIVGMFPAVSETFIIDQVADLMDRGIDVEIFSFQHGDMANVSSRYYQYHMAARTHYLEMPVSKLIRFIAAIPLLLKLFQYPQILRRALSVSKYGADARSLKLLFWSAPFIGQSFDLYHCHFGPIANHFIAIREIVDIRQPLITSFYGYDASLVFRRHPKPYEHLLKQCSRFLVMSENMKKRLIMQGFAPEKIAVQPVGIRILDYPFKERKNHTGPIEIVSVGRFVEKKGFDDFIDALAIVKKESPKKFRATIIGDGLLHNQLHEQVLERGLKDTIRFTGTQPIEKIIETFGNIDFFVQASKTAPNGDME